MKGGLFLLAFCKTVYNPPLGCDHHTPNVDDYMVMRKYLSWRKVNKDNRGNEL